MRSRTDVQQRRAFQCKSLYRWFGIPTSIRSHRIVLLLALGIGALVTLAPGAVTPATADALAPDSWGANLKPDTVAAWADAVLRGAVESGTVHAASVSVVRGSETLLLKGYGIADATSGRPATGQTPFRSGSVSKLFTAIAVLQLAETGAVSLDEDINRYLRRGRIETARGLTTLRHLLTHTGGFEERFRDTLTAAPLQERATADYMRRRAHEQVRTPGLTTSYSNHGMGIAGLIIEDVSGMTYGDYVSRNIFAPLGFRHAGVEFPGKLPALIAVEHDLDDEGSPQQRPLLFKTPFYLGSGGFFYSAEDMSKFMRAALARSDKLLRQATWNEALRFQAGADDPRAGGIGLGFWIYEPAPEGDVGLAPRIIGHGGATEGFRARLLLFPKENIGLFFTTMRSPQSPFDTTDFSSWEVALDFVNRFRGTPERQDYDPPAESSAPPLQDFAGVFLTNRRPYAGAEVLYQLLFQSPQRVVLESGALMWSGKPLRRIGARAFELNSGNGFRSVVSFSEDLNTVWSSGSSSFTRYPSWHPSTILLPLMVAALFLALAPVIAVFWPWRASSRWIDGTLAAAALSALFTIIAPLFFILAGDHPRVESPRYVVQYALAWTSAGIAVFALAWLAKTMASREYAHPLLAVSRAAGAAGLVALIGLFVAYDTLRASPA